MLIFIKSRLVFFATPKTASTSIEMALGTSCEIRISKMPNAKHTPYRKYKRLLEPFVMTLMTDQPDTMALIREPVDWLGSWYRYRSRPEIENSPNSTAGISFDQFVEAYLTDKPPAYAQVGSQGRFLSDKDGKLGMSHMFRYEDVDTAVTFLQNRLNRPISLGRSNTSPEAELDLSASLRAQLQDKYALDFELYEQFSPDSSG